MIPPRMKASLFITCLGDLVYPQVGAAVVKLLRKHGCEVDFPAGQTCCGQPFFNNGYFDEARPLAERMLNLFEKSEYVVTPSGSCAAMVREHFPMLFPDEPNKARAAALAAKTYELVEFLVNVLKLEKLDVKLPAKATYHYSCHLRGLGVRDEAQRLLSTVDGLELAPMEKFDQCCGFGGTFAVKMDHISGAMVREKVRCIAATGAQLVTATDAGCLMNISGALSREGVPCKAVHIAQVLTGDVGELPEKREFSV
jgi:L-lactate dehydrogenase complex protein LldE